MRADNPFKCVCGTCESCVVEKELAYLTELEEALWLRSNGNVTRYLELIGNWMDLFNEQGGALP